MNSNILGKMEILISHFVGNKNEGEGVRFSDAPIDFDTVEEHFKTLANNSFKTEDIFQFHFLPKLDLNPVYQFVKAIFDDKSSFIEETQNCARFLYDNSLHPKIKGGELHIGYFTESTIRGKFLDAIILFKSESKEEFIKVINSKNGLDLKGEKGISVRKIDKGCIVFNTQRDEGYWVLVVDNTSNGLEAQYWVNDFLGLQRIENEYHQTRDFLGIAKDFVTKQLDEEFDISKADKINLLNRSVEYFKTRETFDKREFENEVFQDPAIRKSFHNFDSAYRTANEVDTPESFSISSQAVKSQARSFKSVLKLDKNFHVYIHGNADLIEKGVELDGRKFYKIYYESES